MESFESSGAAKRRRLTCRAMPADGVVKKERSAEHEVGSESSEEGKMERYDLRLQLMRQIEDMENHIRRLADCDRQESVMAEEASFEKPEVADSVKVRNEPSVEQEIRLKTPQIGRMDMDFWDPPVSGAGRSRAFDANGLRRLSSAGGSHAAQGVEVFEFVAVANKEARSRDKKSKGAPVAMAMAAAERPFLLAAEQKPAERRRYKLAKQSGVRDIRWSTRAFAWAVHFPKVDSEGKFISWTSRRFAVKKFMISGCTEAEADAAALEAAKAFRTELVENGILREPKLDPNFTSEVPGVFWQKSQKKWMVEVHVQVHLRKRTRIRGCFNEKAAAEAKALELREKHGLQGQMKPVPTLANRYAGLPVLHPKVPYPGVKWNVQEQQWHAKCQVGGAHRNFRVKPKDHSEAELERSFEVAVAWKKKQEKEKQGKAVKPKAKPRKNQRR